MDIEIKSNVTFPKTWTCECGSDRRLTQEAFKETHCGQAPETHTESHAYGLQAPTDIVPRAVVVHWDICADCGRTYAFRAEIVQGKIQMTQQPQAPKLVRN